MVLPLGIINLTVTGWARALASLAAPAYAWALPADAAHIGSLQLVTPLGVIVTTVVDVALTLAMPVVVRSLGRVDTAVARCLLRAS